MGYLPRDVAQAHWDWLSSILEKIYVDAFEHGYKHGYEDAKEGK